MGALYNAFSRNVKRKMKFVFLEFAGNATENCKKQGKIRAKMQFMN